MNNEFGFKYQFGACEFEANGKYLTLQLRDSTDLCGDVGALCERISEEGYLFLPGFHERGVVLEARREILARLVARGAIDAKGDLMDGVVHPEYQELATSSVRNNADLKGEALKDLVYGERIMQFFAQLFQSPATSFQFQWLRAAGPGAGSPIHCDAPYMSRGSSRLLTCWTPLGDISAEMGPLVICEGSHRWQQVVDSYGQSDVDRDLSTGVFSNDPAELVDVFGGRWVTTNFQSGDVVIMTMQIIHASLTNSSDRFRISCDTRYQPAADEFDERWAGTDPRGHDQIWNPGVELEPVAVSRQRWGV
ncbi:MAG: phytanoyl-CoA dioxygenase family protein [Bythopirellula sp.]